MTRAQLEHILRAAAAITGTSEFVVVGSQAVVGQFDEVPGSLAESMEADLFTFRSAEDAQLVEGSIGEGSPFHETFGYYVHGVDPRVVRLPRGWRERLVPLRSEATRGAVGLCLEAHDLGAAKLAAGRDKDIAFVRELLAHGLVSPEELERRLATVDLEDAGRRAATAKLERLVAGLRQSE